jgi:hypothetical protein
MIPRHEIGSIDESRPVLRQSGVFEARRFDFSRHHCVINHDLNNQIALCDVCVRVYAESAATSLTVVQVQIQAFILHYTLFGC